MACKEVAAQCHEMTCPKTYRCWHCARPPKPSHLLAKEAVRNGGNESGEAFDAWHQLGHLHTGMVVQAFVRSRCLSARTRPDMRQYKIQPLDGALLDKECEHERLLGGSPSRSVQLHAGDFDWSGGIAVEFNGNGIYVDDIVTVKPGQLKQTFCCGEGWGRVHVMNCSDLCCRAGDYLLRKKSGEIYPISEEVFNAIYKNADEQGWGWLGCSMVQRHLNCLTCETPHASRILSRAGTHFEPDLASSNLAFWYATLQFLMLCCYAPRLAAFGAMRAALGELRDPESQLRASAFLSTSWCEFLNDASMRSTVMYASVVEILGTIEALDSNTNS
eukprot:s1616_g5.t1